MPHVSHVYAFRELSSLRPISARLGFPCLKQQLDCEWKTWELWGRWWGIL